MPFTKRRYRQNVLRLVRSIRKITSSKYTDEIIDHFDLDVHDLDLANKKSLENFIQGVPPKPGLYLFRACFQQMKVPNDMSPSQCFQDVWAALRNDDGRKRPAVNQAICDQTLQSCNNVWYPFYLGIEQNLQHRLRQHIFEPSSKGTYALRLSRKARALSGIRLSVSYFEVPMGDLAYLVVELYEQALREYYQPLVGRGRRLKQEQ